MGLPKDAIQLGPDNYYTKSYLDGQWIAIIEYHKCRDGEWFGGWVPFDTYPNVGSAGWQVVSYEPLELSPSLLCNMCGNHGFIRAGKWVSV